MLQNGAISGCTGVEGRPVGSVTVIAGELAIGFGRDSHPIFFVDSLRVLMRWFRAGSHTSLSTLRSPSATHFLDHCFGLIPASCSFTSSAFPVPPFTLSLEPSFGHFGSIGPANPNSVRVPVRTFGASVGQEYRIGKCPTAGGTIRVGDEVSL